MHPEQLRWTCQTDRFSFKTTQELSALEAPIGQKRAMTAIEYSLGVSDGGFNLYVAGQAGTGRSSAITQILTQRAKAEPVANDWCYVHDLETGAKPKCFLLPAGTGKELQADVAALVKRIAEQIPKIFESKEYEQYKGKITGDYQKKNKKLFDDLENKVSHEGFGLQRSVSGLVLVPAVNGEALTQSEFDALDPEERKKMEEKGRRLQHLLNDVLAQVREIETQVQAAVTEMEREIVNLTISHLFEGLMQKYHSYPDVVEHLKRCQQDIVSNIDEFRPRKEPRFIMGGTELHIGNYWDRYQVNLLVDNAELEGAPVVFETNPTYFNLFGRIEHVIHMGNATTDFTMIKPGALHRANGGYLILDCRDLLINLFSYEALKRCLRNKEIRIEDISEQARLISMVSLKPAPIPFQCKIILIGEARLYHLLHSLDHDFRKYFKVKADFDHYMENCDENAGKYAQFIATQCREHELLPFDRSAVARVVEYAARQMEDQRKLSSRFLDISDLVKEAAYYAAGQQGKQVTDEHVKQAYLAREYRGNRIEKEIYRLIEEQTILVDTRDAVVGQINGLSIYAMGDYSFGVPARITATTYLGKEGVVNIEREVKTSGAVHDKGMMILSGFFGQRFAQDKPLAFSASICFEQTYGSIEGDSASSTELYALLSAFSGLPIKQGIAVTGSVNQQGQVQAIGGVNEKIEGFFEVCKIQGLTGEQGVVIPEGNIMNLMLKDELVEACREGTFHVWAVSTVDEGIEILTGVAAGEFKDSRWSEATITGHG
jgi:lon-related putative ATP-dependent protease